MTNITTNGLGEPLPWEVTENLATISTSTKEEKEFKCGNPDCKNKIDKPSFCSEECRNVVYNPTIRHHKHWTLQEMQDWCRKQAERVRDAPREKIETPPDSTFEAAKEIFKQEKLPIANT